MNEHETQQLHANEFLENLSIFSLWMQELLTNNGSEKLNDEGGPAYQDYGGPTLEVMAYALAHSRLLHLIAANLFVLHQGDISEEQMHHCIDAGIERLELENPFTEDEEEE